MSCVCRRWRSWIMNDEYFLNRWFSRSLKRSHERWCVAGYSYSNDCYQLPELNIDPLLFPINLRSSDCEFLPWTDSEYSCDYKPLFEHCYHLSPFQSSHSFSFWLFLPHQCELNIQIGNFLTNGVSIVLCADTIYHFGKDKSVSIASRWIHIALIKTDLQHYYQIWIDGQYVSKSNQYYLYFNEMEKDDYYINMVLRHKFAINSLESSNLACIADLNAFKRCLTLVEIRAIYQQQTSISQIKVGTYIKRDKTQNRKVF